MYIEIPQTKLKLPKLAGFLHENFLQRVDVEVGLAVVSQRYHDDVIGGRSKPLEHTRLQDVSCSSVLHTVYSSVACSICT